MAHEWTRRGALGVAGALAAAPGAQAAPGDLPVTFCSRLYDRMLPLFTGAVKIEGVDLQFLPNADHRQVFDRMENGQQFGASELSFSDYLTLAGRSRDLPFIAVPVFSSRVFRHGFIFVKAGGGITEPKHLAGQRVGISRWGETAVIWERGMLQDEYGLDLSGVRWVTGSMNGGGAHGTPPPLDLLRPFHVEANTPGRSLSQALEAGEVAAVMGAELPDAFGRNPDIVRLLPDYRALEKDWYRRTRLYPIMHVIVVRRDLHERAPWFAQRLATALQRSKEMALADMQFTGSLLYMLPWLGSDIEEWRGVFGQDPWPYGLEANRPSIEAMQRYMFEQGLTPPPAPAESLFAPVTIEPATITPWRPG